MINVELFFNFDPIYPLYKTIREWFAMSKKIYPNFTNIQTLLRETTPVLSQLEKKEKRIGEEREGSRGRSKTNRAMG